MKTKLYSIAAKKRKLGGKGIKLFLEEQFSAQTAASGKQTVTLSKDTSQSPKSQKNSSKTLSMKMLLLRANFKRAQNKIVNLKENKKITIEKQKDLFKKPRTKLST